MIMNKLYKYTFFFPALLGLLAFLLAAPGCTDADGASNGEDENAPSKRTTSVETLVLTPASFEDVIEITGTVEAIDDAVLSAQSAGTVVRLAALGQFVRSGEIVAQLDPTLAQAAVEQAEAMVESAEAQFALSEDNFNRQQPLYQDSIISAIEFEGARAQFSQARAQLSQTRAALSQAKEQLANTRVTTPFAGIVEERLVEQGEQVMPGSPIARVVNTSSVKVTAGVPERYAGDIRPGTPVQVGFQAYGGERRIGKVTFVGSTINPDNRTFPIEVKLDNSNREMKPQMVTQLYVVREKLNDVVVVPQAAIIRDEDGASVYVVERTDTTATVSPRTVVPGPSSGGQVVVLSGVSAGDEVVVIGQTNVTRGDAVQVVEQHRNAETVEPAAGQEDASNPGA